MQPIISKNYKKERVQVARENPPGGGITPGARGPGGGTAMYPFGPGPYTTGTWPGGAGYMPGLIGGTEAGTAPAPLTATPGGWIPGFWTIGGGG